MSNKQKLELTWIGKDKRPKLEPRILVEDPDKSYHAAHRVTEHDQFDNRLIFGDNLLALKALEQDYSGKVKCIFIDPPYNTGSAFGLYDDGVEHSLWLGLMRDRLELLRNLLSEDGSIYVSIDYNEAHYLKVLMDEVFGRNNFQREIIWRIGWLSGYKTMAKNYIRNHDTILYYSKNADKTYFNKVYLERKDFSERFSDAAYKTLLSKLTDLGVSKRDASEFMEVAKIEGLSERYPLEDTWNSSIYDKLNSIAVVSFSGESVSKMLGVEELKGQKAEALIRRILLSSTEPGDLVLDSFAGTGTTGAVAQKMNRRWVMIEIGNHADTHIVPRLKKVIDGDDQAGITRTEGWQGGGGFRYYKLAPSLIIDDHWGNPVINPEYNAAQLAEALAKLEGFAYAPSDTRWWQHGHSSERDFLYVTTQNLSAAQLQALSDEVSADNSLLVCCAAFRGVTANEAAQRWPNLTLKKIPKTVLSRCEWGHDDYSLNVANLPMAAPSPTADAPAAKAGRKRKAADASDDMFGEGEA